MKESVYSSGRWRMYVTRGWTFLHDHPQLWFTLFVALVITVSFVFIALRFAGIARDAQEQLFNDRAGWLLDAVAAFAPEHVDEPAALRERLRALRNENATIESIMIIMPEGEGAWRTYVHVDEVMEENVITYDRLRDAVFTHAWNDAQQAYTGMLGEGGVRKFVTARQIPTRDGSARAVVVATLTLSEADRVLTQDLYLSMVMLGVVLLAILLLFFRHARIVDFATLYKKQLEVDQMKDSFLSMASHELKSPLSVIRGYIEYLEDESLDTEKRREFVKRIGLSADELRQLVEDILDVSRIEMGRLRFSPKHVIVREVVEEVADMFKETASSKGLAMRMSIPDGLAEVGVLVDRGRLKQVLVNLVSNALKYTLRGSVTLAVAVRDGVVECSVRDTGVGMSADEQQQLFSKFYRVENDDTRAVRGTGLGLWITKYLIEHMQGTVSVESIKGEGSRFVVAFPVHEPVADTLERGDDHLVH